MSAQKFSPPSSIVRSHQTRYPSLAWLMRMVSLGMAERDLRGSLRSMFWLSYDITIECETWRRSSR